MHNRTKLTNKDSIDQVIHELTVDEKLNLVGQYTALYSMPVEDMDIPSISLADGATGVNGSQVLIDFLTDPKNSGQPGNSGMMNLYTEYMNLFKGNLEEAKRCAQGDAFKEAAIDRISRFRRDGKDFICFPSGINVGAAFDRETAERTGRALGLEMRDSGVDICLGPNVDIARDPLGGRNYEMYGEDPCLVEETGAYFIRGVQSSGTGACAKHFIANNQETNRNEKNSHVSIRALRELYSRGFMSAVEDADVMSVMCAYNAVNGTFSAYNKTLLTDWLRKEWGFQGLTVTDWGAASENKEDSLTAGIDMILCGPNDMSGAKAAIENGTLSMEVLDNRVRHVLETILKVQKNHQIPVPDYDQKALLKDVYDCIVDGAVLLKNKEQVLPLPADVTPAFYGSGTKEMLACGSGSTAVPTTLIDSIYGAYLDISNKADAYFETMEGADVLIYTAVAPAGENMDRDAMDVCPEDRRRMPAVLKEAKEKGLKTVVVLNVAGPVDMRAWEPYTDTVLCIFIPGSMGGKATVDLLFGKAVPGGKLPVTFPLRYQDTPSYPNYPGDFRDVYYGEGVFVGYKSYDKREMNVAYPFGYGLSYTSFDCTLHQDTFALDLRTEDYFEIPVQVRNTGNFDGTEVIQVYAEELNPHILRPVRELVGYGKARVKAGEEKEICIKVKKRALRYFDDKMNSWVTPIGEFKLKIGTSSRSFFAEADLTVTGDDPYLLGIDSRLGDLMANPNTAGILLDFFSKAGADVSEEMLQMVSQMSLRSILAPIMIQKYPDAVEADFVMKTIDQQLRAAVKS